MTAKIPIDHLLVRDSLLILTNENEAGSNDVCQQIASKWFIVLSVTFAKEANERVEFVLTQTLSGKKKISLSLHRHEKDCEICREIT